jgi:hypothetical protein
MDRMGHSSTRAALIYLHSSDERQRVLAAAVGQAARAALGRAATASGTEAQVKYHEPGAPGRIRTRDPLLRRRLSGVAGRRLESFYVAISCIDRGWAWLDVALRLSQLAPFLAPPI